MFKNKPTQQAHTILLLLYFLSDSNFLRLFLINFLFLILIKIKEIKLFLILFLM